MQATRICTRRHTSEKSIGVLCRHFLATVATSCSVTAGDVTSGHVQIVRGHCSMRLPRAIACATHLGDTQK